MAVIGIDLGTTYSAAAQCVDGTPEIVYLEGDPTLPSVVGLKPNGQIAIGKTAKHNQAKYPDKTVVEVKRLMGKNVQVQLGERTFTPPDISSFILHRIKELAQGELGEEITGAVISCPAYFKDPARQATKQAAELAGLNVLRIINEPTAAACAYGVQQEAGDESNLYVVYDLGGGTFDVTVIRMAGGQLEVIGTGGDPELGGGIFDDRIVDWMLEHLKAKNPEYVESLTGETLEATRLKLKKSAEEGKKTLCSSVSGEAYRFQIPQVDSFQGRPVVFNEVLTMETFEELISDKMTDSLQWIDKALEVPKEKHNYTEEDITAILLVGGSTRVPLVRRLLEERFPSTETRGQEAGINPDEIVAIGASIVASELDPDLEEMPKTGRILIDVTGHTLSVAYFDKERQRQMLAPIIPKESQIPRKAAHDFASQGDYQDECKIEVYQGEGEEIDPDRVTKIGEFKIRIARIKKQTPLRVGLDLDKNGILVAHATDRLSGQKVECLFDYSDSTQISPEEFARRQAQLQAFRDAGTGTAPSPFAEGQGAVPPQAGPPPGTAMPPATGMPRGAGVPPAGVPGGTPSVGAPLTGPTPEPDFAATTAATVDVTTQMNPILRSLYQKAINSFSQIPADRQSAVIQLVSKIEQAARADDQETLNASLPELATLLEGVGV